MPNVTYDGQSFQLGGRRTWIVAASIHYARSPRAMWPRLVAAVRQAGFVAVETAVPWLIHEPRQGRYEFTGDADLRAFLLLCGEAGLRVILRVGPYVGGPYDGGGIPAWLFETPGIKLRQHHATFLERVGSWFQRLFSEIADLQITRPSTIPGRDGGPLVLMQCEHAWHCSNDTAGQAYLSELIRYMRECGVNVPLLSANDLWQEVEGLIETWSGWEDLLVNLRQLRAVQSHAPRLVSGFDVGAIETWGQPVPPEKTPDEALLRFAQVLAAGGQVIVSGFHSGTNFGFLAGRRSGADPGGDGFITTRGNVDAMLDDAGRRTRKYSLIKRLASFAGTFGHVLAELDPDYHPIALDVEAIVRGQAKGQAAVVPLQGPQGRIVFVFSAADGPRETSLMLENGIRLPVYLGDQPVGWFAVDVDLAGNGRLDFANLCPYALVERSILVLQGPAKATAHLSINGSSLELVVPTGAVRPEVIEHKGITVVVCNQQQIDATICDGGQVYVGVSELTPDGAPIVAPGFAKAWRIGKGATVATVTTKPAPAPKRPSSLAPWLGTSAASYSDGTSARYATLEGPQSLSASGVPAGYGWYRLHVRSGSAKKKLLHAPFAGDRLHVYLDGKLQRILGSGPGSQRGPFDVKLASGDNVIAILADAMGRFVSGNDFGDRKGIFGPVYELAVLKGVRCRKVVEDPVDPFVLHQFIVGRAVGQAGSAEQLTWAFSHRRKTSLLLDFPGVELSGTVLLNDEPIGYYAGRTGAASASFVVEPATSKFFKPGANTLRFAPDAQYVEGLDKAAKAIRLYEVVHELSERGTWGFAKWEPPTSAITRWEPIGSGRSRGAGAPCWWKSSFTTSSASPVWIDLSGLSKGQLFVNHHNVGRFWTATATGKAVGPQKRLFVPAEWLRTDAPNEVMIFDEHGFAPTSVKVAGAD